MMDELEERTDSTLGRGRISEVICRLNEDKEEDFVHGEVGAGSRGKVGGRGAGGGEGREG